MHCCHHCGTPTEGALLTYPDENYSKRIKMCQACWDYIGSPAAGQPGATMQNRIKMERQYRQELVDDQG